MPFCYISESTIPSRKANSVQVMQMCDAFSKIAKDVTLYCRASEMPVENPYEFYGVGSAFKIQSVVVPRLRIVTRLVYAFKVVGQLRQKSRPLTIYARDLFVAGLACLLVSPKGTQVALEVHGPPHSRFWRWWVGRMIASGRVRTVVAISDALAQEYLSLYPSLPRDSLLVAHDGARPNLLPVCRDSTTNRLAPSDDRPKIGYVGSLRPGKGMEIIQNLAPLLPGCDFHVVGGDSEVVQSWKAKANIHNLVFHGFVEPAKTESLIATFDVVLAPFQPSVLVGNGDVDIAPWMSPLKIFEYMRMGKAIIASDLPVLREVLVHGHNAVLASPTDPFDWAEKISTLLTDITRRETIGRNAYNDLHEHYTWNKRATSILNAL